MPDAASITPARIGQKGGHALEIAWADGVVTEFEVRALRLACACASCIDEWTGKGTLDPTTVPDDVRPLRVHEQRGNLYLLAHCYRADALRTFRLDRVVEMVFEE